MVQSSHQAGESEGKVAEDETSQTESVARRGVRSTKRQADRAVKLANDRAIHSGDDR